jgi:5'-3' exonuclease
MFANIHAYVLRVLEVVRPVRLLFVAIDGVAPRAKMN